MLTIIKDHFSRDFIEDTTFINLIVNTRYRLSNDEPLGGFYQMDTVY